MSAGPPRRDRPCRDRPRLTALPDRLRRLLQARVAGLRLRPPSVGAPPPAPPASDPPGPPPVGAGARRQAFHLQALRLPGPRR